jgi:cytochrome c-type biogenesis protein CcmH
MFNLKMIIPVGLLLVFFFIPVTIHGEGDASREDVLDIAKEMHPPGCTDSMTADYCTLFTAYDLRMEIAEMLAAGKNKDQIINELVQKYGERILAAPQAQGFHLLAWFLPGIAIAAGGITIGFLVFKWARKTSKNQKMQEEAPVDTTISAEQKNQVRDELKEWL